MNDHLEARLPIILREDSATSQPSIKMGASSERLRPLANEHTNILDLVVLGMCSGAALDVVTCALLRYRQQNPDEALRISFIEHDTIAVPPQLRTKILNLLRDHPQNPNAMADVHNFLGYMYSSSAKAFLRNTNMPIESIHLLTARADSIPPSVIPHIPPTQSTSRTDPALKSWTAVVAAKTDITTVTTLPATRRPVNATDANVGQPLEALFLQHSEKYRVCLTIGELVGLTVIPPIKVKPAHPPPTSICGPGSLFINYVMRYMTSNNFTSSEVDTYCRRGTVNESIVDRFLESNDYSTRIPSLNIATEMFGQHEVQSLIDDCFFLGMSDHDTIATITRITAENVVRQYNRLVAAYCPEDRKIEELFICGQGALNMAIVDYLEDRLPKEVITRPVHDIGIPGDAMEALCCAQLGLETILKHAANEDGPFQQSHQDRIIGGAVKGRHWDTMKEHIGKFGGGREVFHVQRVVVEND